MAGIVKCLLSMLIIWVSELDTHHCSCTLFSGMIHVLSLTAFIFPIGSDGSNDELLARIVSIPFRTSPSEPLPKHVYRNGE